MADQTEVERLAKEMGDAGYCNQEACREYLQKAYAAGERAMRERAVQACHDERLLAPTEADGDIAYDSACVDCEAAIGSLPLTEGK
jgi:hypothetical protein